jgi:hypothetical protein
MRYADIGILHSVYNAASKIGASLRAPVYNEEAEKARGLAQKALISLPFFAYNH